MYNILLRRLYIFIVVVLMSSEMSSQQVTREQLLKLFYQAQSALNKNQPEMAIDAYTKILKLSPGLSNTYLQLGNLYSTMQTDAEALEKACVCYAYYLELEPETEDDELLKARISELTSVLKKLRGSNAQVSVDLLDFTSKTPVQFGKERLLVELPQTSVEVSVPIVTKEKNDTVVLNDSVKSISNVLMDDMLFGRWVSAELGYDGRENWILDIDKDEEGYYLAINDSSFLKKTNERLWCIPSNARLKLVGNELIATYVAEQKVTNESSKRTGLRGILDHFLNVNINLDLFSDADNVTSQNDVGFIISNIYQFNLKYDGFKLSGTVAYRTIRKDSIETLLSERVIDCDLFKVPTDYIGFTYKSLTDAEKASNMELRMLLNRKSQEAMENAMAVNDLGCMYASGVGTVRNMKMAVAYFKEASMKKNLYGMLNMARLYVDGLGVDRDMEKARALYKEAFEQGYSDAMVMCGDTYLVSATTDDDYKNALDCYLKAVYKRCPYAFYRLGLLYKDGLGIEANQQKALEYYQKAVDMQYPDALTEMGLFYKKGDMVEQNMEKAMELLTKAANKGHANAMYELYRIFLYGDGVNPDFKYAKDWYYKYMKASDKVIDGYNTVKSQVNSILLSK